ncbi:MAG: 23S rRNA (adenine(2503)-C(2))-methyltransferase RlmN [Desulfotomaculaceae bacterium]|nr:23S rRNA (adenine(2503)-C(2))-methyltransferase RlmN [Desulfotomaculaceae bacterium]
MAPKINLKDLTLPELIGLSQKLGGKQYRAKQIASWIFQKGARSFHEMTNLPMEFRSRLAAIAVTGHLNILAKQVSRSGDTIKYLFEMNDGQSVESVLMKHSYGNSACISTQVGCRMGCRLCASGLEGLIRNLSPGEIYGQVLSIQKDYGERVSHVVVMGSGEPLDNYEATLTFIKNITASHGLNIGQRHITVSTCGIAPRIKELAREKLAITLAVSLHAPDNNLRDMLVPVNKKYPLQELMSVCEDYSEQTGRRITFEYALLAGLNDSQEHADKLCRLLSGMLCHVNLIPVNPVPERFFRPPSKQQVDLFRNTIETAGIPATIRRGFGAGIDAACGQLRRRMNCQ